MIGSINFEMLFLLIFSVSFYIFFIYLISPEKSVSFSNLLKFFIVGCGSVVLLKVIGQIFPYWNEQNSLSQFDVYFKNIAAREELVKFISFCLMYSVISKPSNVRHPISYMFYFSMVGLGFATIENVFYTEMYGIEAFYSRLFTATVAHVIFGTMFGYWIAISKIKLKNTTVLGRFLINKQILKKYFYIMIGYISAVFYHGLWNFNISTSGKARETILFVLILLGIITVKIMYNDINRKHSKSIK